MRERLTVIRDAPWTPEASQLRAILRDLLGDRWRGHVLVGETSTALSAGNEDAILAIMSRARDHAMFLPTRVDLTDGDVCVRFDHGWTDMPELGPGLVVVAERPASWGDDVAPQVRGSMAAAVAVVEGGDELPLRLRRGWIGPADAQRVWGDHLRALRLTPRSGYVVLSGAKGASEENVARELAETIRLVRSGGEPVPDAGLRRRPNGPAAPAEVPQTIERPTYLQVAQAEHGTGGGCAACEPVTSGPVDETAALDMRGVAAALAGGALPFGGTTTPTRLDALRQHGAHADEEPADGDETMALPTALLRDAPGAADFAAGLRAASFPELGVDHYAALVVELELKGAEPHVLRRHGIATPGALDALHREQARRMAADPGLRARFEDRRAHFARFARKP